MIPEGIKAWRYIAEARRSQWVPADLILALIWQESSGNPWAERYEKYYQYFWDRKSGAPLYDKSKSVSENRDAALAILGSTEFNAQCTSRGLMQVMGAVARERGFPGQFLTELCDPEIGIEYGVRHLTIFLKKYELRTALLRYNGGGRESYPDEVLKKLTLIRR